jgi:hypothetical protein
MNTIRSNSDTFSTSSCFKIKILYDKACKVRKRKMTGENMCRKEQMKVRHGQLSAIALEPTPTPYGNSKH